MRRVSKRFKQCLQSVQKGKAYTLEEAVATLKGLPSPKFDQTVEIACKLNIDPKQSEQMVRGSTILPHGTGKEVRVCAFCKGEDVAKAQAAGADFAGDSALITKVKNGWLGFERACATPEIMKELAQLGKILGPRGMMPSPKTGTLGADIARIVKELKQGKVQFKTDKTANLHAVVGRISFSVEHICDNVLALIRAIQSSRPAQVKGRLIKNITISTTMGPGIKLDMSKLSPGER